MHLILARHGNTFAPGERVVWIGAREDKPLAASGIQQAKNLAEALGTAGVCLSAIYCGPLQRAVHYAQQVIDSLDASIEPIIEPRLNEIDYGAWAGLTSAEIRAQYGDAVFDAWDKHGQWPQQAGWGQSAKQLSTEMRAFVHALLAKHCANDTVLCVSSNGRLRDFLALIPRAFDAHAQHQTLKVATGHICQLSYRHPRWSLDFWNQMPGVLGSKVKVIK